MAVQNSPSALKSATFLIALQVSSRATTFLINQILLRFLTPELLGISTQLELYSISVLYFSRDSLRVAFQRQTDGIQDVINLSYISVLLGLPLNYIFGTLYLHAESPDVPYFVQAVYIYALASFIELCAEPAFVTGQQMTLYRVRASAETAATVAKCLITCGTVVWSTRQATNLGVLPFAFGQLGYATFFFLVYAWRVSGIARDNNLTLLAKRRVTKDGKNAESHYFSLFSRPLAYLAATLYIQSILKYILTQGDSLLIASLTSLRDQGAYALASNYGSLLARMLFQPIEESSRSFFARTLVRARVDKEAAKKGGRQAQDLLRTVLRAYGLMSLIACAVGPTLAPLLLQLIAGKRWAESGAGEVLSVYCYYIPPLALNGVTEGFVAATASNEELGTQSRWMGTFFMVYAGFTWVFLRGMGLGAKGIVWANCVNMGTRLVWNMRFITGYFRSIGMELRLEETLPVPISVGSAVVAASMARVPTTQFLAQHGFLGQLAQQLLVAAVFAVTLLISERRFLLGSYQTIKMQLKR